MALQEVRVVPVLQPGTPPAVETTFSRESSHKSLYKRPTVERDGFAIHPATPDREQLITDRLNHIGTPQPIYEGLVYVYEHNLFDGIDPKEWNATTDYYTRTLSMENLAKGARTEYGLHFGSMWPTSKMLTRVMDTVKKNALLDGFTEAEEIDPKQRKNMQADIYAERQRAGAGSPKERARKRNAVLAESPNATRRRRASETLAAQRQDPEFNALLKAADPTRVAHIKATWRKKTGHPMSEEEFEQPIQTTPVEQAKQESKILDTQEALTIKQIAAISPSQRQVFIAEAYSYMQHSHESGLLTLAQYGQHTVGAAQQIEELSPFGQGVLLMYYLQGLLGIRTSISKAQGKNILQMLGDEHVAATIFEFMREDQPLFKASITLANAQYAFPEETDKASLGGQVLQRAIKKKQEFLYGVALMHFLASHAEQQD